jgi:hypothetical protein
MFTEANGFGEHHSAVGFGEHHFLGVDKSKCPPFKIAQYSLTVDYNHDWHHF